ncbi:MAG: S9 family peptidase [Gammaproteobacteria bacterium]|nr:S9 family peptidase [Gammaproteobacteria bacterium]
MKISPSGTYLAITVDRGDQDVLTVMRTEDLKVLKVNQLPDKRSVGDFYWVSDDRLLFNAVRKQGGFAQPFLTGEWFGVNADGSAARPLVFYGTRGATERGKTVGAELLNFLDPLLDEPGYVLMSSSTPRSSEGAGTAVVRMDVMSGRRTTLTRAPAANCGIALDQAKAPRFAVCGSTRGEDGAWEENTTLYRLDEARRWQLVSSSANEGTHLTVIRTSDDGTVYASRSDGKAPASVGTLDTTTGEFTELYRDPVADVSRAIWSTDGARMLAVVTEAGAPKVSLVDESHPESALYQGLAAAFPGQLVRFANHTRDGKRIVVVVEGDRNPGELYLFDRDSGQARFLMSRRQWLDTGRMAEVKPFVIQSGGMQVHGYLTIPNGSDGRNLPLIVNPHGGPIGPRDSWFFNPEAQLLASRGYAVLQVNYRGSGGYGKAFTDAGHKNWATGIQDDIIAATRWAIDQGHADGERVCIYGGSFGGYSSLMAPIRAPGLFKCAFGYVGVYDLEMMYSRGDVRERDSGLRYLRHTIGRDPATLKRDSPAARADEVRIPVYLAAGARDRRTPPEQTEAMAKALTDVGNAPEGVIIEREEMHGYYDVEARVRLYTEMLGFFDRHIGKQ